MYQREQSYTLEEYWRLAEVFSDRKYEYTNGTIRMMTGDSLAHGQISGRIFSLLDVALRNSECNVYNSDVAFQIREQKLYYPDASVSCDPADWTRKKAIEAPTVVVEVLSPSTEQTDKVEKLEAYQDYPTIQEILFIDSRRCSITHYRRINFQKWEVITYRNREDRIVLASLDISFLVGEIYFKVYLELEE